MKPSDSKNKISKESDSVLDKKQVLSAIKAIKTIYDSQKSSTKNLFELTKNPYIYMNFIVNKLPEVPHYKDVKLELPNSVHGSEFEGRFLFIVTNEFKAANKQVLSELKGNWKFIKYEKVKLEFKEYKDKRGLLNNYDLFFCDKALITSLKKSLGTKFFERKKYPSPVDLTTFKEKTVEKGEFSELLNTLTSKTTYMHLGQGTEFSVKIGRAEKMSDIDVLKNAVAAFKEIVRVFKQLDLSVSNIRRIVVRGEQSESLPVYSYLTEEEKKMLKQSLKRKESK